MTGNSTGRFTSLLPPCAYRFSWHRITNTLPSIWFVCVLLLFVTKNTHTSPVLVDGFVVRDVPATTVRRSRPNVHQCFSHRAMTQCRRVSIAGVSVSPTGFWAMLGIPGGGYWPLQITTSEQDAYAATTPEALTVLQLLSGVDMAGAILPPDTLAKLVVLHAEEQPHTLYAKQLQSMVELPDGVTAYSETNDWQRSKLRLPQVTLDELTLNPLRLDVSVKGLGPLSFSPSATSIEAVTYNYDPQSSTEFVSLSLALRYRAPIIIVQGEDDEEQDNVVGGRSSGSNAMTYTSRDDERNSKYSTNHNNNKINNNHSIPRLLKDVQSISHHFPLYSTVEGLHRTSQRVTRNLERGFQVHKLQGALRIAQQRGDVAAEYKIQCKLDELLQLEQDDAERQLHEKEEDDQSVRWSDSRSMGDHDWENEDDDDDDEDDDIDD